MEQLIKITEQDGRQVVSAKDLHTFLEVKETFTDWFIRMAGYGFTENIDYQAVTVFLPHPDSPGGTTKKDFALTMDCAKEISMLQRTEKGKQARLYFIEMEKRARQAPALSVTRKELAQMLLDAENEIEQLQIRTQEQEKQLITAAPKVQYHDKVLQSKSLIPTTVIAKELGMSAITLNKKLHEQGIQHQVGGIWVLYAKYQDKGWTGIKTTTYTDSEGRERTIQHTYWTEKGRRFIHSLFNVAVV